MIKEQNSKSQSPASNWPNSQQFYNHKRITVTGGAGFLGSFVVEKLRERGVSDVFIPRSKDYDLRFSDEIRRILKESRPNIVIHLAARVGGIGANQANPAPFFYDNLMMGVQLLHESCLARVEKFVAVGTVCSYPKFTPVPFREEDIWDGYPEETNAPYGLAKKMLLVQSQTYRQQYGFNSIFLLPANMYGPRDNFDPDSSHVIPALIRKCIEAKERNDGQITAWGTGKATREFLYVEDAAEGILMATERYNESRPVNLGTGTEISIEKLAHLIAELTGFKGNIVWDATKPDGQPRRFLNTTRSKNLFGFQAKMILEDGLRETVKWYLENRNLLSI